MIVQQRQSLGCAQGMVEGREGSSRYYDETYVVVYLHLVHEDKNDGTSLWGHVCLRGVSLTLAEIVLQVPNSCSTAVAPSSLDLPPVLSTVLPYAAPI